MTTPMTRDEIVELMAREMEKTLTYEVERDVLACDLTREEQSKVASASLRALEAAGCQIVQGEPVATVLSYRRSMLLASVEIHPLENGDLPISVGTPLYAGKVQP